MILKPSLRFVSMQAVRCDIANRATERQSCTSAHGKIAYPSEHLRILCKLYRTQPTDGAIDGKKTTSNLQSKVQEQIKRDGNSRRNPISMYSVAVTDRKQQCPYNPILKEKDDHAERALVQA